MLAHAGKGYKKSICHLCSQSTMFDPEKVIIDRHGDVEVLVDTCTFIVSGRKIAALLPKFYELFYNLNKVIEF